MTNSPAAPETRPEAARCRFHFHNSYFLIALIGFLAFQPALRNEYAFDDVPQVEDIAVPVGARGLMRAVAEPWWPRLSSPHTLWRPVTRLSILIQKRVHPNH